MSVIHAIAWGMIDEDQLAKDFRRWRREARAELRTHNLHLIPRSQHYVLERRGKKGGHKRYTVHAFGSFVICMKMASQLITPSNPEK